MTFLLVVLAISAALSVLLCWSYISKSRELRSLQAQAAMVNNNRNFINLLANEALEYSKRNPAIDPILQQAGVKPRPGTAPAPAKPAGK